MKTTELFIEQVFIGLAVLLTAALMLSPDFAQKYAGIDLSKAVVIVAGAYLIAITDRFSDTLLQDLERHCRLLYALGLHYASPTQTSDPFPEDEWRCKAILESGASEYLHYLRSRIRLARGLASLGSAAGMAAALSLIDSDLLRITGAIAVAGVYSAAFLFKITRRPRPTADAVKDSRAGSFDLPRTTDLRTPEIRSWYERRIGGYDLPGRRSTLGWQFPVKNEPLVLVALLLAVAAGVTAAVGFSLRSGMTVQGVLLGFGIAVGASAATALCGWTWWRMLGTLFAFLRTFAQVQAGKAAK